MSPSLSFCKLVETNQNALVEIAFTSSTKLVDLKMNQYLQLCNRSGEGEDLAYVLRHYKLAPKDKVILAYIIAQAYHQFYDSDLMRAKWSSKSIWFMPQEDESVGLPLRPYLTFPSGERTDAEKDFIDDERFVHRCPRILTVGILLLEIASSTPFPRMPHQQDSSAHANKNHQMAVNSLTRLKQSTWNGSRFKDYYEKAVEYCLWELGMDNSSKECFVNSRIEPNVSDKEPLAEKNRILKRRQAFYNNVVLPLKWVAEIGFQHQAGNLTYICKNFDAQPSDPQRINETIRPEASFNTKNAMPNSWFQNLSAISRRIEEYRRSRAPRKLKLIRVAILDTGCFDKHDEFIDRIIKKKDFVCSKNEDVTDTFGHGTFMTKLVTDCALSAGVIVARVAENTELLEESKNNIKEVKLEH
jgi:hypothetical protein